VVSKEVDFPETDDVSVLSEVPPLFKGVLWMHETSIKHKETINMVPDRSSFI